ncbi:stem-specific protein TSJT1-like [Abrus precatorius]|uniref:Stem-specific protein TSJT1-like n=1 Tax=Abrus precatorius TaxID=3816 RepID=A0A8B8KGM0_ABRPR|nr:stem-specific protein TSJT1-like [Abrus precatorius]
MLAIFHKTFAHPPEELNSPASYKGSKKPKVPEETLKDFLSHHPHNTCSMSFGNAAVLAYVRPDQPFSLHQRLFCGIDDIYCLFLGSLNNLSILNKQYGLSKGTDEAMFVIEAYKTLRDRGPYPADQVVKELDGRFAFVVYDSKVGSVFAALGSDGGVKLYWGIAADGSVVISDDLEVIKEGCAKSFAPFPTGCMFHSEGGLMSFEHPMNKLKAMPRVDSEGAMCGANFKVDKFARVNSIPRVGSQSNWMEWDQH